MSTPMGALLGVESPPFRLPGSHFGAALGFLVLGGVGLVLAAPLLADGVFLAPRVTAVTHLFTLGWITTSIMGALYQLLPVALHREVRWPGAAQATLFLHAPGLLLFVAGLAGGPTAWTVAGASLLAAGFAVFVTNLAVTLRRSPQRDLTWWALALAHAFLVLTVLLGWTLSANLRWSFLGNERLVALGTHLHVALVGWVLLVVVGVGHRLLPMFLLSHGADERPARWAVGLLASGTALLFALHHVPGAWARQLPGGVMLAGMAAFLVQVRAFYRARKRPVLDAGMRSVVLAVLVLAAAAVLGGVLLAVGLRSPALATTYGVLLVLGLSLFVAAHYYKIVPFLVFYHRFGPLAGREKVPTVAELYSGAWAWRAGLLLAVGVVALALGVALGNEPLTRGGAALFLAGALVEAVQMAVLSRRRPA